MSLLNTSGYRGKTFVKGSGVYLYDEQGEKYLDLMTNYGVNIFGYNHPRLTKGLTDQLESLPTLHNSFANEVRNKAARKLVKKSGGKISKVYFSNSGSEAVEAAIKFAKLATGKDEFIAMKGSFHGKTIGALAMTESPKYRKNFENMLLTVKFADFGDIDSLENIIDKSTAAVILEPIQGESGIIIPPVGYLKEVEEICIKLGVLLILDEIQTGTGRTGTFLASQKENVKADIICLGKGLSGGIPLGATLVSESVARKIPKNIHSSTLGGNPLACRGVLETLALLNEKRLDHITKMGDYFLEGLRSIDSKRIVEIRAKGLMIGAEVNGDRNQILKDFQKNQILAAPAADNVVRFLPPYIVTKAQINTSIKVLKQILN